MHESLHPQPGADSIRPTALLVSVRDATEARTAVDCGVDLIDIKEPRLGPLGAATADTIAAVARQVRTERPLSIALGELLELQAARYGGVLSRAPIRYAKIGLAGAGRVPRWWLSWRQACASLGNSVGHVGVVYVDWHDANAPSPPDALAAFADHGCAAILFDTYRKDSRSLLDHAPRDEFGGWIERARLASKLLVLGGSLTESSLGDLRPFSPDYVAIRGAACRGGRLGQIDAVRVRRFSDAVRQKVSPIGTGPTAPCG